ncbi:MAG: glycosyltransferase family 4 protein [Atopobiaceae bacterium]|jgi:glycosyltransferase involved in cell wall biosynthesis
MRILNVTAQKPDATGSGIYLSEMVKSQAAQGHETAVICGVDAGEKIVTLPASTRIYAVEFTTEKLPFHVLGMSDVMPYAATRYRDLTPEMAHLFETAFVECIQRAVSEFKPDIIISHHLYLVTALVREIVSGIPVGAVCHSTGLRQLEQIPFERERIKAQICSLDAIFALHEAQAARIVRETGADASRIQVVGAGINRDIFTTTKDQIAPVPGTIFYAGKIWSKKGVACLIHALDLIDKNRLPEGIDTLRVRMAGGAGQDRDDYERICLRAQTCRWPIEFLGKLPQENLADAYRAADVYVLPSFYEGLPLVVGEALACGCKDVVTALPGLKQWFAAHVQEAPIVWIDPPRMASIDEPCAEDLPAFEERLAQGILAALAMERPHVDVSAMGWDHITQDVIARLVS